MVSHQIQLKKCVVILIEYYSSQKLSLQIQKYLPPMAKVIFD